jgi:hypothetical protein
MPRDFFDPPNEQIDVVLLDGTAIVRAERPLSHVNTAVGRLSFPFDRYSRTATSASVLRQPTTTLFTDRCAVVAHFYDE